MKLKDIQNIFHRELDSIYEKEEVNSFFFILIEYYYNFSRIQLALDPGFTITKAEQESIFNALYLLKEEKPEVIHSAIYQAMEGGSPLNPSIARKTLKLISRVESRKKPTVDYGLTARQKEILQLLANGLSYEQIAINLFVSKGTVRKHIENLYRKLQVNNKVDAINKLDNMD